MESCVSVRYFCTSRLAFAGVFGACPYASIRARKSSLFWVTGSAVVVGCGAAKYSCISRLSFAGVFGSFAYVSNRTRSAATLS